MSSSEQTKDPGVLKSMGIAIAVIFSVLAGLIIISLYFSGSSG
jgi:hypothetical protein